MATSRILTKGRVSGGETVVVMESSEHRSGVDRGVRTEVRWPGRGAERGWPPVPVENSSARNQLSRSVLRGYRPRRVELDSGHLRGCQVILSDEA